MKKEQIEQLKKLQLQIEEAEKAMKYLTENFHSERIRINFSSDSYYWLPIERVGLLKERVLDLLQNDFEEYLEKLIGHRDSLVVCVLDENQPNYKPTEI
jgi:hypothetical protein